MRKLFSELHKVMYISENFKTKQSCSRNSYTIRSGGLVDFISEHKLRLSSIVNVIKYLSLISSDKTDIVYDSVFFRYHTDSLKMMTRTESVHYRTNQHFISQMFKVVELRIASMYNGNRESTLTSPDRAMLRLKI